jgi:hypothetical protein
MPPEKSGAPPSPARRPLVERWLVAFGKFWWDFLVGDTPELLIGVLVALGIVAVVLSGSSLNAVAVVAFPAMVAALLALSVFRTSLKRRH